MSKSAKRIELKRISGFIANKNNGNQKETMRNVKLEPVTFAS
jgi:hypothetical protein